MRSPRLHTRHVAVLASVASGFFACSSAPEPSDPFASGPTGPPITGTDSPCVTATSGGAPTSTQLVILFDRSGSMGNRATGFDPTKKWDPVTGAVKSFAQDPRSTGMAASLTFFPRGNTIDEECGYDYASPVVKMSPLPSAEIASALAEQAPGGGTPTYPALDGAYAHARASAANAPSTTTAVVLVTDGLPGYASGNSFVPGCPKNAIGEIAKRVESEKNTPPHIRTFVIGVGSQLQELGTLAQAGGTAPATFVSVDQPDRTSNELIGALGQIRKATQTCSLVLPPPPDGKRLDIQAVNVIAKEPSGKERVIDYDPECAGDRGWHYDSLTTPSRVELCPLDCVDPTGRVQEVAIAFGCRTTTAIR